MAASSNAFSRRSRYVPAPAGVPPVLAGVGAELLRLVAEYGLISLPQLARLIDRSPKATRRHMRSLFDAGLAELVVVPRESLGATRRLGERVPLGGSAPNLYRITRAGLRALDQAGAASPGAGRQSRSELQTSLFLAHQLEINDVRIWLEVNTRHDPDHALEAWHTGAAAEFPLGRTEPPVLVRPDAWFVYRLGEAVLVGLVEVDRGTERGLKRWQDKLAAYELLFASGRLRERTGYVNARILVTTPTAARRDHLAELVTRHAPETLQPRFWFVELEALAQSRLTEPLWRQPGVADLRPIISAPSNTTFPGEHAPGSRGAPRQLEDR